MSKLTTAPIARNFILAGRAVFTVVSGKTGKRFTFQVCKARLRDGEAEDTPKPWFVKYLSGANNTGDFSYLGMIHPDGVFTLTRASRVGVDAPVYKAWMWVWSAVNANEEKFASFDLWHEGLCGRCGRRLTTPESIEMGIGPKCASYS